MTEMITLGYQYARAAPLPFSITRSKHRPVEKTNPATGFLMRMRVGHGMELCSNGRENCSIQVYYVTACVSACANGSVNAGQKKKV